MFQSPLHRGTLFNSITSDCRPIIYIVSVPSSSGHSLQQRIPRARNHEHDSFSPLFIGALSSTRNVPICLGGERRFSPLFIGALSSTEDGVPNVLPDHCFSPLFIGALSSTASRVHRVLWLPRFSPLFIGELSSTERFEG